MVSADRYWKIPFWVLETLNGKFSLVWGFCHCQTSGDYAVTSVMVGGVELYYARLGS